MTRRGFPAWAWLPIAERAPLLLWQSKLMATRVLPILVVFSTSALAQSYLYSPTVCDFHEGTSQNTYPFHTSFHYQQVHADTKGTIKLITGLAWRRDCIQSFTGVHTPRTLDAELIMGDGNFATTSGTFASNYTNTPVKVFNRKNLNCPDHTVAPEFQPAVWDVTALFDTPYVYLGTQDLVYEIVVHSSTSTVGYYCDAYVPTSLAGGFSSAGGGCTTSNGVMRLRSNIVSTTTTNAWTASWAVTGGPSSRTTAVMVGFTNPSLTLPGLCSPARLYTDNALFTLTGTTTAAGAIASLPTPALSVPFTQSLVGLILTAQAASIDPTQPGLGVSASNGNAVQLPPQMPASAQIGRVYAFGSPSAATGTWETTTALVTRFQ